MAEKLVSFFKTAKDKAGIQGLVKVAMITKISTDQAATLPDSPENIAKFESALAQLG